MVTLTDREVAVIAHNAARPVRNALGHPVEKWGKQPDSYKNALINVISSIRSLTGVPTTDVELIGDVGVNIARGVCNALDDTDNSD